jgi:hypothetical protein
MIEVPEDGIERPGAEFERASLRLLQSILKETEKQTELLRKIANKAGG